MPVHVSMYVSLLNAGNFMKYILAHVHVFPMAVFNSLAWGREVQCIGGYQYAGIHRTCMQAGRVTRAYTQGWLTLMLSGHKLHGHYQGAFRTRPLSPLTIQCSVTVLPTHHVPHNQIYKACKGVIIVSTANDLSTTSGYTRHLQQSSGIKKNLI